MFILNAPIPGIVVRSWHSRLCFPFMLASYTSQKLSSASELQLINAEKNFTKSIKII